MGFQTLHFKDLGADFIVRYQVAMSVRRIIEKGTEMLHQSIGQTCALSRAPYPVACILIQRYNV
jgi:hypothetical protein